jgi:hypothetical protein
MYSNDALYNPGAAAAPVGIVGISAGPIFNLTTNTAKAVRLVSAEIRLSSLATALNRTGTIYGALRPTAATNFATGATAAVLVPTVPSIQNVLHKIVSVVKGESLSVSFLPSDEDDLQFLSPNTPSSTRHINGDDVYEIVLIGQGLQASSAVKVDIYVNYEVIPLPETSLAGLETQPKFYKTIPALEIEELKAMYSNYIIKKEFASDIGSSIMPEIYHREPTKDSMLKKNTNQELSEQEKAEILESIDRRPAVFGDYNPNLQKSILTKMADLVSKMPNLNDWVENQIPFSKPKLYNPKRAINSRPKNDN